MQETHLDSRSYPGAILFPGDIWQCLIWGHIWLSELGVGLGSAGSGGGTGICGWGQGHANHPAGPRTGPRQRAPRVSSPGRGSRGLGQAPSCSFRSPFPFGGWPCVTTGTTCYYCGSGVLGGDIQGTGSPVSRKRKQSCSEEGSPRHE